MLRVDSRFLAPLLALLTTSACVADTSDVAVEPDDGPVASSDQAIINGNSVDPNLAAISTVVAIVNTFNISGCSGALLTNTRVVSAKHCFPSGTQPNNIQVTMGNQLAHGRRLRVHPTLDVAVVDLDTAFIAPDPNAPPQLPFSDHGFRRVVYAGEAISTSSDPRTGSSVYLEQGGQTLNCSGYGEGTVGGFFGTLRQAYLTIPQCIVGGRGELGPCTVPRGPGNLSDPRGWPPEQYYWFRLPRNSLGQRQSAGDSGGPCFYGDKLVSVFSTYEPISGVSNDLNSWSWASWLSTI